MGERKSRAELLQMEAEVAVLEEAYDALKAKRPRCKSCKRLKVTRGVSELDQEIRAAGEKLRSAREVFRTERARVKP